MPERVSEKRKPVRKKLGVDWWAVILALAALGIMKLGLIQKIPW